MSFPHRINSDGTIDSICDHCFMTVGTSTAEAELASFETAHACEPARVEYYRRIESSTRRPPKSDHPSQTLDRIQTAQNRR